MSNLPLLSIENLNVSYSRSPLLENVSFSIGSNDRICLSGKNGTGKSSIMKIIYGISDNYSGKIWYKPSIKISYLQQHLPETSELSARDFLIESLFSEKFSISINQHSETVNAADHDKEEYTDLYKIDMVIEKLKFNADKLLQEMSGGELRKLLLSISLLSEPDLLILDEPTNHLDIESILWLEQYLINFPGAVLCTSHDQSFLDKTATKVFWIYKKNISTFSKSYKYFRDWMDEFIEAEQVKLTNLKKRLNAENHWYQRGVTARRKRNERRKTELLELRETFKEEKHFLKQINTSMKVDIKSANKKHSTVLSEFINVYKSFGNEDTKDHLKILEDFSYRIIKGERIGVVGANGSGKTTFLKTMLMEIEIDQGKVKLADSITTAYYNQTNDTKNDQTIKEYLAPDGGDYITVQSKKRHVASYLKDFLFDPQVMNYECSTLSGGQKNRLALAKALAVDSDLLILDEPTNDLDIDTMEKLQEILHNYQGTLIIVSHDRTFLDNITSTLLIFEGDAKIVEYSGDYTEYLEKKAQEITAKKKEAKAKATQATQLKKNNQLNSQQQKLVEKYTNNSGKLSFKYTHEISALPKKIEANEELIQNLTKQLETTTDNDKIIKIGNELSETSSLLMEQEEMWLELVEVQEILKK